jgi:hypothetical protein
MAKSIGVEFRCLCECWPLPFYPPGTWERAQVWGWGGSPGARCSGLTLEPRLDVWGNAG